MDHGSTNWIPLHLLKESNPIQVAEYAKAHQLQDEPAFAWWISTVLRRRDRIISKVVNRRQIKGNRMKFGIVIPNTVEEAYALDAKNGNTFWKDAIDKEMTDSRGAFEVLEDGERAPGGFKCIGCHMIFEVKADLRRKARYVAQGFRSNPPASMTYASVVSRDSVRLGFLIAALNGLNVLAGDIQNTFLNADCREKVYFIAGKECGPLQGRKIVI